MRDTLVKALLGHFEKKPFVLMTGDLGFMALEPLQKRMGQYFINAGVAEQNMVSVAAGMAREGLEVWCYSIAPFLYARAFEQIRNDVCLHTLPVKLIGNGGGYGYGVMGATHHAIEDYGVLATLQNMKVFVPAFDADVPSCIDAMGSAAFPSYLRLGRCEQPKEEIPPMFDAYRRILHGLCGVAIVVGPLIGTLWSQLRHMPEHERPMLWAVSQFPVPLPDTLKQEIRETDACVVMEEHVAQGGVGCMIAAQLLEAGLNPKRFKIIAAKGYPDNTYGSQNFHREKSDLTTAHLLGVLKG